MVPVEIHRNIELHLNNKEEGARILKSWGLALGTEPEDDEYWASDAITDAVRTWTYL